MYNAETCVDDLEQNQGDPNEMSNDEGYNIYRSG